jgi:hypothetical protein
VVPYFSVRQSGVQRGDATILRSVTPGGTWLIARIY